jgi:hypothetical protein
MTSQNDADQNPEAEVFIADVTESGEFHGQAHNRKNERHKLIVTKSLKSLELTNRSAAGGYP